MKKLTNKGFSSIETILILVIIVAIGGVGYWVYLSQKETKESLSESKYIKTSKSSAAGDSKDNGVSANWKRFESGKGAFSIKIADGMSGFKDTSSDFIIVTTYKEGEQTNIKDVKGYGTDGKSVVSIYQEDTSKLFEPTEALNLKETKFVTSSGISGTRRSFEDPYKPPCEGIGCYLGTKQIIYDFSNKSTGKTVRIWYSQAVLNEDTKRIYSLTEDDPDLSSIIDAMAKTLEIN